VEKRHSIFVSDSARDASALCTEAGAGTFRVVPLGSHVTSEAKSHGENNIAWMPFS
jgi:hypothetical protein